MTYEWIFANFNIEMLKTSTSAVKRIGQRFVIKETINMVATLSGKSGKTKKMTKVRKSQEKMGVFEKKS